MIAPRTRLSVPLLLLLAGSLAPVASGQTIAAPPVTKLNDPLPIDILGAARTYQLTPDEQWLVYVANADSPSVNEIYSVRVDGSGEVLKLNTPAGVEVNLEFAITSDGQRVVYRAPSPGGFRVWSAKIDASEPPVRLNNMGSVTEWGVSPDGQTVALVFSSRVHKVPIDGSAAPVELSDPTLLASSLSGFTSDGRVVYSGNCCGGPGLWSSRLDEVSTSTSLTPDFLPGQSTFWAGPVIAAGGTRVVFRARRDGNLERVYSVPVDGSALAVELNGPMDASRQVSFFLVSPDSQTVVYLSDEEELEKIQLSAAPADGSAAPIRISGDLPPDGDVWVPHGPSRLAITPDGTKVVYAADADTDEVRELYVVPIDVAEPDAIKLSAPMQPDGDIERFVVSPDNQWVAYMADQDVEARFDLYGGPIDGSAAPTRLNTQTHAANGGVSISFLLGQSRVFYIAFDSFGQLFSAPRDGSGRPVALADLAPGGSVADYLLTSGPTVLYRGEGDQDGSDEIYRVPEDASSPPVKLSGPLTAVNAGDIDLFDTDPTGTYAVYTGDQIDFTDRELFSVPVDRSRPPIRLNADFAPPQGFVLDFQFTEDGSTIVYLADQIQPNNRELYRVPIDGSAPSVRLNPPLPNGSDVDEYSIEGDYVVYLANPIATNRIEIFSVPLDLSSPAVKLNVLFIPNGDVLEYAVDPAHTRVVYIANHEESAQNDMYSVPIDGSSDPVKLTLPLPENGDVMDFAITDDGAHVVFTGDVIVNNEFNLYAVPIDGSQPPVEINGPMITNGDVSDFKLDERGRVLYRADGDTNQQLELYSVEIDGTQFAKVSGDLVAGGGVSQYEIGRNGRVAYAADQITDSQFELFSAPIDGSETPIQISNPLPATGNVGEFAFHPEGTTILYLADSVANGDDDLFFVPADGSLPAVRLNDPLPPGGDVLFPERIPDDGRVVFVADQLENGVFELFSTPLSGGPVRRISDPLVFGGDVSTNFALAGSRVVYRADQEINQVFELYATSGASPIGAQ